MTDTAPQTTFDGTTVLIVFALVFVLCLSSWALLGRQRTTPKSSNVANATKDNQAHQHRRTSKGKHSTVQEATEQQHPSLLQAQTTLEPLEPLEPLETSKQAQQLQQKRQQPKQHSEPTLPTTPTPDDTPFPHHETPTLTKTIRPPTSNATTDDSTWTPLYTTESLHFNGRKQTVQLKLINCPLQINEIQIRILATKNKGCNMCQLSNVQLMHESLVPITIEAVHASGEHPPSEIAVNLLNTNKDSKWLDIAPSPRWIRFKLKKTTTCKNLVVQLTSGNDCAERDPKAIVIEGRSTCDPIAYARVMADQSRPTSTPLTSIDAIKTWMASHDNGTTASSSVLPLQQRDHHLRRRRSSTSKIMVCHDMMGGYTKHDRFDQGSLSVAPSSFSSSSSTAVAYAIYHWHLIDIFVYFSHHLITIPPKQWINATHKHGVKCYGTMITEWKNGAEMCAKEFFATSDMALALARTLSRIGMHYGFDGWLINIENNIDVQHVANVHLFLDSLQHNDSYAMEVCWYDSITSTTGQVEYQNELNAINSSFLKHATSFFTNYRWNGGSPRRSAATARKIGCSTASVFMGCDVFGRKTYGGGGFDVDVALRAAFAFNTSLAIFAPGWIYEHLGAEKNLFLRNNIKFWNRIETAILFGSGGPPIRGSNANIPILQSLPLHTNFGTGRGGRNKYTYGGVEENNDATNEWTCLSMMDVLPLCWMKEDGPTNVVVDQKKSRIRISIDSTLKAFHGSDSVLLQGVLGGNGNVKKPRLLDVPLYSCQCELRKGRHIVLSLTYRMKYSTSSDLCVTLNMAQGSRSNSGGSGNGGTTASSSITTIVLRGGKEKDTKIAATSEEKQDDDVFSLIIGSTSSKVFCAPVKELQQQERKATPQEQQANATNATGSALQAMANRATKLRKQGKSTATIAAILRVERAQQKNSSSSSSNSTSSTTTTNNNNSGNKEEWSPWKTRCWRVPCSLLNEKRILKSIGITCVATPSSLLSTTTLSPFCAQLGELHLEQPRNAIPGERSIDRWSLFKRSTLNLNQVIWSSCTTVCFTIESSLSKMDGLNKIHYFASMNEQLDWKSIGTSVGDGIHSYRVMHMQVTGDVDRITIGAVPSPMHDKQLTHGGSRHLFSALNEGPKAMLQVQHV